jgi:Cof subfamily protein (haloacid dehalogenase superfamily)
MKNSEKIKLIALDIDGTIMNKEFNVSDRVRQAISRAINNDVHVVLATGRMYSATVPIASDLGIKTPLICYQGALVREYYNSDKVYIHKVIEPYLSSKIIEELRALDIQINVYLDDELFIEDESNLLKEYSVKRHIIYHKIDSFDKISNLKPTKILALDDNSDKVTDVRDYLRKKYSEHLYITKSTPYYCEIANKEISKGKAVLHLAEKWNIKQDEIMVIGDQDNDREMLEVAGVSIAMGNAADGLKDIADFVTDTVDNDGAAIAIEKFVFNEDA